MSKYTIKSSAGYFVAGSGFVGTAKTATVFNSLAEAQSTLGCAKSMGINATTEEVKVLSYAVVYIRKGDLSADGVTAVKQTPNTALGQVDPSKRRFATFDEAVCHGSRFAERRANRTDQPGTAGHRGFYVVETTDPVNAKINWKTRLTNPV